MPMENGDKLESHCQCERSSNNERERVRCYVDHYLEFQRRRYQPVLATTEARLRAISRLRDLRLDEITCNTVSQELALSLILQSFNEEYAKRHPNFVRDTPASVFKSKVDFFNQI